MSRYDLSEFEWRVIAPLLPSKPRGVARVDDRRYFGARPSLGCDFKKSHSDRHIGRSRGGFTTKIHALTDGEGLPVKFVITPGNTHDNQAATELLADIQPGQMVLADKACDANWLRD